ncbi:MAG: hypothetical protein HUU10_02600 [Bacteroidetes bacterium]|nr:hypothetical protein [Bacteroidota bacterium]
MKNLVVVIMFALALTMGVVACAPKAEEAATVDSTAVTVDSAAAVVDSAAADTTK